MIEKTIKTKDKTRSFLAMPDPAMPLSEKWDLRLRDGMESHPQIKAFHWDDIVRRYYAGTRLDPFRVKWPKPDTLFYAQANHESRCAIDKKLLKQLVGRGLIESATDLNGAFLWLIENEPEAIAKLDTVVRYTGRLSSSAYDRVKDPAMPKVQAQSISVIVNYRDMPEIMDACLRGIARQKVTARLDVYLIDNDSLPQNVEAVKGMAADILGPDMVHHLSYPHPFNKSAQDNMGVAKAAGEVVVLLNNDAEMISVDCLQSIADRALEDNVACAGPLMIGDKDRIVSNGVFIRPATETMHALVRENEMPMFQNAVRKSGGISFCCAAISKCAWEKIGTLDEVVFKSQYNDADFFVRGLELGMDHIHVGTSICRHEPGKSEAGSKEKALRQLALFCERYPDMGRFCDIEFDVIKQKSIPKFSDARAKKEMEQVRLWRKARHHLGQLRRGLRRVFPFGASR